MRDTSLTHGDGRPWRNTSQKPYRRHRWQPGTSSGPHSCRSNQVPQSRGNAHMPAQMPASVSRHRRRCCGIIFFRRHMLRQRGWSSSNLVILPVVLPLRDDTSGHDGCCGMCALPAVFNKLYRKLVLIVPHVMTWARAPLNCVEAAHQGERDTRYQGNVRIRGFHSPIPRRGGCLLSRE